MKYDSDVRMRYLLGLVWAFEGFYDWVLPGITIAVCAYYVANGHYWSIPAFAAIFAWQMYKRKTRSTR